MDVKSTKQSPAKHWRITIMRERNNVKGDSRFNRKDGRMTMLREGKEKPCLYAGRAAGGNRDHCLAGIAIAAGDSESSGSSEPCPLHE